jgi:Sec-independent protein translocase protein TatA
MIGLQPGHLVIIVLIALILFAPSRLPMFVRGTKKMISEIRAGMSDKSKNQDSDNRTVADKVSPQSEK